MQLDKKMLQRTQIEKKENKKQKELREQEWDKVASVVVARVILEARLFALREIK